MTASMVERRVYIYWFRKGPFVPAGSCSHKTALESIRASYSPIDNNYLGENENSLVLLSLALL